MALGASLGPVLARRSRAEPVPGVGPSSIRAENLRVEWQVGPLGIDTRKPRFTWTLRASDDNLRSLEQRAWRVIVASSEAALRAGRGDVWDSGERKSPEMAAVPEQDLPLTPQA